MNDFEPTREGCAKAKAYLIEIGKYEEFQKNTFSTDGWSLVGYANEERQRTTKENQDKPQ